MEQFSQVFGRFLVFVYHCFDRIVINGYLTGLLRPENVVYFFRDVLGRRAITPEVLRERTDAYHRSLKLAMETASDGARAMPVDGVPRELVLHALSLAFEHCLAAAERGQTPYRSRYRVVICRTRLN